MKQGETARDLAKSHSRSMSEILVGQASIDFDAPSAKV